MLRMRDVFCGVLWTDESGVPCDGSAQERGEAYVSSTFWQGRVLAVGKHRLGLVLKSGLGPMSPWDGPKSQFLLASVMAVFQVPNLRVMQGQFY